MLGFLKSLPWKRGTLGSPVVGADGDYIFLNKKNEVRFVFFGLMCSV
jgi:hypothetical protein